MSAPPRKKRVSGKKEAESKRVMNEKASKPTDALSSAMEEVRQGERTMQRQARGYSLGEVAQAGLRFRPTRRGGPLVDGRSRRSVLERNSLSLEGSIPQILGKSARLPASQPQPLKGLKEGLQKNAEPTMINVRSEGLRLDLVLLQNRVSGLTIDYQSVSKSGELQRWLRIISGMLSGSAPSPEGPVSQTPSEPATLPASRPRPLKEEQEEPLKEKEEQEEPLKEKEEQEEPLKEKEEQEEPLKEKEEQEEPLKEIGYRKIVLRAVDVGLDTLGHDQKRAILSLLEDEFGFRENDIPDHPRGFVDVLDELLGPSSRAVEREIMSNIRLVWAAPGENLETVVESLKEQTHEPSSMTGS